MKTLAKYNVIAKLAEGATSTVYRCHDSFAARDVAVKLIHLSRLGPDAAKLFKRLLLTEAAALARLHHPHIVRIFDAVLGDELSYIVMEYVDGGTLSSHCEPGRLLPLDQVIQLIFKCSRALDYAHSMGVTHRDIKPANLLFAGGSNLKVSDFGSAFHIGGDATMVTGVGSPAYMSPEQIREEPLSHQTDIYSLGVVMYQLLTGALPFSAANSLGLMYQIVHGDAVPIRRRLPELPVELERIVERTLARDLSHRYQSWEEFSSDLAAMFETSAVKSGSQVADSEKFGTLRQIPFFTEFNDGELWEMLRFSMWQDLPADHVLFRDGDEGDFFCIIASGQVKVQKRGRLLNILYAGECCGEMAYLSANGNLRSADVLTLCPTRVITIHTPDLRRASASCQHRFDRAFLALLADRLSMANERLVAA